MKNMNKTILFFIAICLVASCSKKKEVVDPIFEFVSFTANSPVNLAELDNSTTPYPIVVQLYAFKPYSEDIDVTLSVTASNVVENTDFTVTPNNTVKIRAGSLTSDTIWVKTIDNATGTDLERTFTVAIASTSKSDLKIGLGITDPKNTSVTFKIADDECTGSPLCIFNTTLNNTIGGSTVNPAAVVLDKLNSKITVSGDLMDYPTFSNATLTLTLTPSGVGSHTGTATFGEQETGTDGDGYVYKFTETGTGSYDADAGTISIAYDIYYDDGGWVYWYSTTNVFSVP